VGVTTHAGVASAVADAVGAGEGEEVAPVWLRPVQAATTAPATTVRLPSNSLRRDITDSRRGFITS